MGKEIVCGPHPGVMQHRRRRLGTDAIEEQPRQREWLALVHHVVRE
jgi:hypothetical protein